MTRVARRPSRRWVEPTGEHVMLHTAPAHEPDQDSRIDDDGVAERGLRANVAHLGHTPIRTQIRIRPRGGEQPEQVLPKDRRRAALAR